MELILIVKPFAETVVTVFTCAPFAPRGTSRPSVFMHAMRLNVRVYCIVQYTVHYTVKLLTILSTIISEDKNENAYD